MTEQAGHTPGTLLYRAQENAHWGEVNIVMADGHIGTLAVPNPHITMSGGHRSEDDLQVFRASGKDPSGAIGRLFVAAPKLLEALEDLLRFCEGGPVMCIGHPPTIPQVIFRVREAIAEAKGESREETE